MPGGVGEGHGVVVLCLCGVAHAETVFGGGHHGTQVLVGVGGVEEHVGGEAEKVEDGVDADGQQGEAVVEAEEVVAPRGVGAD